MSPALFSRGTSQSKPQLTANAALEFLCLANIASGQKPFDLGAVAGHSTRDACVVRAVAAIRFALSMRRDLLLEILALRHQLAVLARSNRRFRPLTVCSG